MSPTLGGTTMLLVGAMLLRLTLTDAYQRYVRVGMGPLLLAAGTVLAVLGAVVVIRSLRGDTEQDDDGDGTDQDGDGHGHGGRLRVGWLLLTPVLALLLVAPPALGSFGVDRTRVTAATAATDPFPALPAGQERRMTVLEFVQRAGDRNGASLARATVRLTGFVAIPRGDGIRLARYQIACCAADAVAAVVRLTGSAGPAPARDTWLTVSGTYDGSDDDGTPRLSVTRLEPVPPPVDPYE